MKLKFEPIFNKQYNLLEYLKFVQIRETKIYNKDDVLM